MRLTKRDFLKVYNVIDRDSHHDESELIDDQKWSFRKNIVHSIDLYSLTTVHQAALAVVIYNAEKSEEDPKRTSSYYSYFWEQMTDDFINHHPELTTTNWRHYLHN